MLYAEFHALTDGWRLMPTPCYKRNPQGCVIHETLVVWELKDDASRNNNMMLIPLRIQAGAARSTEINLRGDQLLLTDYWAQDGQTSLVGASIHVDNRLVEYCLETQINQIADEPLEQYVDNLTDQWLSELTAMAPMIAQYFQDMSIEYSIRMRYQGNMLQI
jgi:hypothetical protein